MEPKSTQGNDFIDTSITDESKGGNCDTPINKETEEGHPAISSSKEPITGDCGISIGSVTIKNSESRESDESGDSMGNIESKITLRIKESQEAHCDSPVKVKDPRRANSEETFDKISEPRLVHIGRHAKPGFTVWEEPNLAQHSMMPQRQMPAQQNVFSTRKEKEEDDEVREEAESRKRRKEELVEMENKLRELHEVMTRQMTEFQRMMDGRTPTLMVTRPSISSESSMEQGGGASFTVYSEDNSRSDSEVTNSRSDSSRVQQTIRSQDNSLVNFSTSLTRQPNLDSTAALMSVNPIGAGAKFLSNLLGSHFDQD